MKIEKAKNKLSDHSQNFHFYFNQTIMGFWGFGVLGFS